GASHGRRHSRPRPGSACRSCQTFPRGRRNRLAHRLYLCHPAECRGLATSPEVSGMTVLPLSIIGELQVTNLPPWALPAVVGVLIIGLLILSRALFARRPVQVVEKAKVTYQRENVAAHGHGEERRRWPRRGGSPTPVLITDPRSRSPAWEGTVIDRS